LAGKLRIGRTLGGSGKETAGSATCNPIVWVHRVSQDCFYLKRSRGNKCRLHSGNAAGVGFGVRSTRSKEQSLGSLTLARLPGPERLEGRSMRPRNFSGAVRVHEGVGVESLPLELGVLGFLHALARNNRRDTMKDVDCCSMSFAISSRGTCRLLLRSSFLHFSCTLLYFFMNPTAVFTDISQAPTPMRLVDPRHRPKLSDALEAENAPCHQQRLASKPKIEMPKPGVLSGTARCGGEAAKC
jgi:hypothetical protein